MTDPILQFMIDNIAEAGFVKVSDLQHKAGVNVTMYTCNTLVTFRLFGRRVSIEYNNRFPVTVSDDVARKPIHEIKDGRALLTALLARGDAPSVREVFPAAFHDSRMQGGMF